MKSHKFVVLIPLLALLSMGSGECDSVSAPVSASGVTKASVHVETGSDGLTVEQRNVKRRLLTDNKPGSIKYLISAFSGQVIYQSTVDGKVTSGGKRLTPKTVAALDGANVDSAHSGMAVTIGSETHATAEVLQDDGTYGDSADYLYWFDVNGRYHQQYVSGGVVVHISDQPIAVKSVIINLDSVARP